MPSTSRPRLGGLARWCLFWTLFIGIGAVIGSLMMWLGPAGFGMEPMLASIQQLPFSDVFFTTWVRPGVFLFLVNGLPQLVTAALILRRHPWAPWGMLACGILLAGWIAIQFVIFPLNPVSMLYLAFALAELALAVWWLRIRSTGGSRAAVITSV